MSLCSSIKMYALSILVLFSVSSYANAAEEKQPMSKPKVIIFDVNETLLDLAPLKVSVGKAMNGREDLLPLWFSTMLHYSLVDTLTEEYHDFGQIGAAALMMLAQSNNIELSQEQAREAIVNTITKLPAHPDVKPALKTLSDQGFYIVSLTNSSNAGVAAQFEHTGLTSFFEHRFSVEDVKAFKPARKTYEWVLKELNVSASDVLMVAAHPWDLAGAKAVGLQTAFVRRSGTSLYPLVQSPDYQVNDLQELITVLAKLKE